ncbi:MAG: hypothetical protein LC791_03870 [Acidobacteria bacterium]|nr:hypothetical protein [Acidobacteriota bacterium]
MCRLWLGVLLAGFATGICASAFERGIDDLAVDDAIRFARRASDADKGGFHRSYVFTGGAAPLSSISLVTEFRRVVLAAEDRLRFGDHLWGAREARDLLRPVRNTLEIVADVNFHPQNAYATVPSYEMRIIPKEGPEIRPANAKITAKYGLQSVPSPSAPPFYPFPPPTLPIGPGAEPLMGAWVAAVFDGNTLDAKAFVVVGVSEAGKDLARISVDLGSVR